MRSGATLERENKNGVPTFKDAAQAVIKVHAENWKDGGKTEASWHATLKDYAFPSIGNMRVSVISTQDVLKILTPIWNEKRATAKKVKQRIGAVMKWSIAEGHRNSNPVVDASAALPQNKVQVKHMKALPYDAVAKTIEAIRKCSAYEVTKLALEFVILTACRSGEVRGAKWSEFDLDAKTWTVPADRMKMRKPHKVPLTARCIEILERVNEIAPDSDTVFPSSRGVQLSDNTLSKLLRDNGLKTTVHGFRSSFRDWAAEQSAAPREIAEYCLAHVVGAGAELAYRRTDYFDKRREVMQQWDSYLNSDNVVSIRKAS